MNAQEQTLLTALLHNLDLAADQLAPQAKDADAERLIHQALFERPDIGYLLVQRHLLLEQALQSAQARIKTLEQTVPAAGSMGSGSFLGSAPAAVGAANVYGQPMGGPSAGRWEETRPAAAPAAAVAPTSPPPGPAQGGSSFLGAAAATATGVLGGALMFQGIEHLMGGGHGLMGGNDWGGNAAPTDVTNITENFYGSNPASDPTAGGSSGWSNTPLDGGSFSGLDTGFDDPASNPINPQTAGQDDWTSQTASDDSGDSGGLFDGLFGDGGDDSWV
jgi:hypothetical protein